MVFDLGIIAPIAGSIAIFIAGILAIIIFKTKPEADQKIFLRISKLSTEIKLGTVAFLKTELRKIALIAAILVLAMGFVVGPLAGLAYFAGVICSVAANSMGLFAALMGNSRIVYACSENKISRAFRLAVFSGSILSFSTIGTILIFFGAIYFYFSNSPETFNLVSGFLAGAISVSLVARVAGGIFNKVADVANDFVSKSEFGLSESDERNPGVIADQVGDNIGGIFGFGSDFFSSYAIVIGLVVVFGGKLTPDFLSENFDGITTELTATLPLLIAVIGLGVGLFGIFMATVIKVQNISRLVNIIEYLLPFIFLGVTAYFLYLAGYPFKIFYAILSGVLSILILEIFNSLAMSSQVRRNVQSLTQSGPSTNILMGFSLGLGTSVIAMVIIAAQIFIAQKLCGNYGVGISLVALLSNAAVFMAFNSLGPILDNAKGVGEMAQVSSVGRQVVLDLNDMAKKNSTKNRLFTVTVSIWSAILALLFMRELGKFDPQSTQYIKWDDAFLWLGMFLGMGLIAFLGSHAIRAVSTAAGTMIQEIRRQFREIPGLLSGTGRPDTGQCIEISSRAAMREVLVPLLLALVLPIILFYFGGYSSSVGLLLGAIMASLSLSLPLVNSGSFWELSKLEVEIKQAQGERIGSIIRQNVLIGDTVGDPLKDTLGPMVTIVLKLLAIVLLVLASI